MSKRRHEDDSGPAKEARADRDRTEQFASNLLALNSQFTSWVNTQKASNPQKFWIEGVRDYVRHATKLLDEFGDLATADGVAALKSAAADANKPSTSAPSFGLPSTTPGTGAAGGFFMPPPAAASSAAAGNGSSAAASGPAFSFGTAAPATTTAAPAASGFTFGGAAAAKAKEADKEKEKEKDKSATPDGAVGSPPASVPLFGAAAPAPASTTTTSSTAPAGGFFSFGAPAPTAAAAANGSATEGSKPAAAEASKPAFTFGAAAAASSSAAPAFGGAAAGSAAPATGAFTFGVQSAAAKAADGGAAAAAGSAPASGGFSFFGAAASSAAGGGAAAAPALGAGGGGGLFGGASVPAFSFGAAPTTGAGGAGAGGDDGDGDAAEAEENQDECAKGPSLQVDENVEFLFKEKARLQVPVKGDDGKILRWDSKGIGILSVRKPKQDGAKPYIALFTESGRCLFQAYFNKTMKLVVSDKQKSVAFTAAWSPDGTSPPALNAALFQMGPGKNRNFESVILKLQEEMAE